MAVASDQVSVGHTTAVEIVPAANPNWNPASDDHNPPRYVVLSNPAGQIVYLGAPGVTSSTGFPLAASAVLGLWLYPDEAIDGVAASGTQVVSYFESGS